MIGHGGEETAATGEYENRRRSGVFSEWRSAKRDMHVPPLLEAIPALKADEMFRLYLIARAYRAIPGQRAEIADQVHLVIIFERMRHLGPI